MSSAVLEQEVEGNSPSQPRTGDQHHLLRRSAAILLSAALLFLGSGGAILLRFYFVHGGTQLWLSTLLQVCGWPLSFIPLTISHLRNRRCVLVTPPLVAASAAMGLINGLSGYMYTYGSSYLPLSTTSLLASSQPLFTALFAFLLVRQRFTPYSVNSVVLLTVGPVLLGLGSGGDRPAGAAGGRYYLLGFFMTLGAAALAGLLIPMTELVYRRSKQRVTYTLVMEMQLLMGVSATVGCLAGMAASKEFQEIQKEAREFGLGEKKYYMVLILDAIFWQAYSLGSMGLIYSASALFTGILLAACLPLNEVLAIIFFKEKFSGNKGVALALSLWGFTSYLYGEMKESKKIEKAKKLEVPQPIP